MTGLWGISILDISIRAWITQLGAIIVYWETLRYSVLTFLGAIALMATFVAMLYTIPKPSMGLAKDTILNEKVYTHFGWIDYISATYKTPIMPEDSDRVNTCLKIEYIGYMYHNFQKWFSEWADLAESNNKSSSKL
ncbi:unnamed protein product [Penicillium salamii]|nr:unnamed protein product [Penicillium salamii]